MKSTSQKYEEKIKELREIIEDLEIQLRHARNDLKLTREEYENSLNDYLEIYSNMEKIVEERTKELRNLQEILEQKGRELQIMLDSSPAILFYKDRNNRYIRVNKTFSDVVGLPIDQIIGKTHEELFPDRPIHGLEEDIEVITTGKPILKRSEYFETVRETRHIEIDRVPYVNINGEVIGIIGFALDVTDLKRAEAEKKELESQLIQAQKMESIGLLAGGVAHDFNNVLGIILGYAQLAYLDVEAASPVKSHLDEIIKATQRATGVVRTLLDYARPQAFEFKTSEVNRHVKFIVKQLRKHPSFDSSRMKIEIIENEPCFSSIDSGKLEQALLNLGKNAIQAIPENREGKIVFSVESLVLSEEFCRTRLGLTPGKYVRISIIDNGVGIPKENVNKVFEPFFTTKQTGEGTGLGLSQVYSIIREHKGYIHLYSEVGEGTRFNIYLKYQEGEEAAEETVELTGDYRAREGETILVVEDTDQMREMLIAVLQSYGYKVLAARNGKEGVEKYFTHLPDIVIMDVKMPVMDGKEAFRKIRESAPEAKIIFSSGFGMDKQELKTLKADGSITKPYDPVILAKTLHDILHGENKQ